MPRNIEKTSKLIKNLNTAEVKNNNIAENLISEVYNANINGPAVRSQLLKKADELYQDNKELQSIYHQTEALCLGFRSKFMLHSPKNAENLADMAQEMLQNVKEQWRNSSTRITNKSNIPNNPLLDYIQNYTKEKTISEPLSKCTNNEFGVVDFFKTCQELPNEWTVVQICKKYNPEMSFSTHNDIIMKNDGIYLSLINYSRWELNNKNPMLIYLEPLEHENIFEIQFNELQFRKEKLNYKGAVSQEYMMNLKQIDKNIIDIVYLLRKWLGPWRILLVAKYRGKLDKDLEAQIFKLVDHFCEDQKFSPRQIILLSLISRSISYLVEDDLKIAAQYIATNEKEYNDLLCFLNNLKDNFEFDGEQDYYPCLLIVDELLDQFPWEMLFPNKELCRISSIHILLKLYKKYEKDIKNGYINLSMDSGNVLLNPDNTLSNMEKRLTAFVNYWSPHWNKTVHKVPTLDEMKNILTDCDVFVYCGHGSGLQFINPEQLSEVNLKCVALLFGCDSVKMSSNGLCSEMQGTHLYYHHCLCPLVVGAINIITDFYTDQIAVNVLSSLITSKKENHFFSLIDAKTFKNAQFQSIPSKPINNEKKSHDSNLLRIFSYVRMDDKIPIRMRSSFVARGLPVWNSSK